MLALTFPILPSELNKNSRAHWARKAPLTKRARTIAFLQAMEILKTNPVIEPPYKVDVEIFFKNKARRDTENVSVKPYLDGLFDAFKKITGDQYLYDDSRVLIITNRLMGYDPNKKGFLVLKIEHLEN